MMQKHKWFQWISGAVLSLCMAWQACAYGVVTIDVNAAETPFMYGSQDSAKGLYPAIIEAVFAQMNVEVHINAKPWQDALLDLDQGMAGVGGIDKTADHGKGYDYSDPLFVERIVVLYNKRHPLAFRSLKDLDGKRVGVIAGMDYGREFAQARSAQRFSVEEANSDAQNLDKLAYGRLDAVLAVDEAARAQIRAAAFNQLAAAPVALIQKPAYLVFNKKAHAGKLLHDFNAALAQFKQSPFYLQIVKQTLTQSVE